MDSILIKRLEVFAYHGVNPEEQKMGQKFYVTARIFLDTEKAAKTDNILDTVHYGHVCRDITQIMQTDPCLLIEKAADRVARGILSRYPAAESVTVTLEKPQAPVKYHFETISVTVSRKRHIVYIASGSNIGERESNISEAYKLLAQEGEILAQSQLYETAPYGYTDQPAFMNGCIKMSTLLSPEELLDRIHAIEAILGRKRDIHWGPRTIDLDIIFFDNRVIETEDLTVPHADMKNREFVLKPLVEIAPDMVHPVLKLTVRELLDRLRKEQKQV
ncbi:MAG: 2-amino-4-hydroxy-6-hydroxymethyldihydropteridine diphosphokinase [Lachnospiraceae bacterium]|nr:2-amino-4-hydroxy-6-hydroxymethyldihydropteridine diphosphokinase [Lachnospiraceae bacterium]